MGLEVHFYCGVRELGWVHFSQFTLRRQQAVYGLDWGDCITYDVDGEEFIGDPAADNGPDDFSGKYEPLWDRGLERAHELLAKVKATECQHRKEYDLPKVEQLVALLERCAASELREYCRIEVR